MAAVPARVIFLGLRAQLRVTATPRTLTASVVAVRTTPAKCQAATAVTSIRSTQTSVVATVAAHLTGPLMEGCSVIADLVPRRREGLAVSSALLIVSQTDKVAEVELAARREVLAQSATNVVPLWQTLLLRAERRGAMTRLATAIQTAAPNALNASETSKEALSASVEPRSLAKNATKVPTNALVGKRSRSAIAGTLLTEKALKTLKPKPLSPRVQRLAQMIPARVTAKQRLTVPTLMDKSRPVLKVLNAPATEPSRRTESTARSGKNATSPMSRKAARTATVTAITIARIARSVTRKGNANLILLAAAEAEVFGSRQRGATSPLPCPEIVPGILRVNVSRPLPLLAHREG